MTKTNDEREILKEEVEVLKNEVELLDKDINLAAHDIGDKISKNTWVIAVAILLSGVLIGGGLFFSGGFGGGTVSSQPSPDNVSKIVKSDHIRGSAKAPVKIIEFSDLECPYCKTFHNTMNRIIDEYGETGQVAWVYRHLPLTNIHPKAIPEAQASECAAELGGNDAFWAYVDRLFEITPSNNGLNLAELPNIAEFIGLDRVEFEQCLVADKYKDKIAEHAEDAANSGAQGTPYSILITKSGKKVVINGAQSYETVKQMIEAALR